MPSEGQKDKVDKVVADGAGVVGNRGEGWEIRGKVVELQMASGPVRRGQNETLICTWDEALPFFYCTLFFPSFDSTHKAEGIKSAEKKGELGRRWRLYNEGVLVRTPVPVRVRVRLLALIVTYGKLTKSCFSGLFLRAQTRTCSCIGMVGKQSRGGSKVEREWRGIGAVDKLVGSGTLMPLTHHATFCISAVVCFGTAQIAGLPR